MATHVGVAIIGAGSAGLAALKEVRKVTKDFVVIDDGPLGTTCARVGCMPSKALIQAANERRRHGKRGRLTIPEALERVRRLRDRFTSEIVGATTKLGSRLIRGRAMLLSPTHIRVGKKEFIARRVILATGSSPLMPEGSAGLGAQVVTTDSLFELEDLPGRIAVLGLGSVGIEIGQALSRLGCTVTAFDRSRELAGLTDPAINAYAVRHFRKEFDIHCDSAAALRARGGKVEILAKGRAYACGLILASLGRRPNLDSIGLESIGVPLDARGLPVFDRATMKISGLPLFLAGDVSARRMLLHEAADDGRIAGYNSVHPTPRRFKRRAPLAITFSEPNLALVGQTFAGLEPGSFVTGEAGFETQARSLILGENYGLLHVYAGRRDGKFLGAEMIGPAGEHLAHLMAWALQMRLTVPQMLQLPFYHPVVEEGLRTALRDAAGKLGSRAEAFELAFAD